MMTKNQKGNIGFVVLVLVVVVAVFGYLVFIKKEKPAPVVINQYQQIQGSSDLKKATSDLDLTDTTSLDAELNQLSSDSAGF